MNKKKSLYEAPTIDILEVQFEESVLTVSQNGFSSQGIETFGYDPEEEDL